jgi:uncharacterized protein YkwD
MTKPMLIRDGVLTGVVLTTFFCLFVLAQAFHEEPLESAAQVYVPVQSTTLQASAASSLSNTPSTFQTAPEDSGTSPHITEPVPLEKEETVPEPSSAFATERTSTKKSGQNKPSTIEAAATQSAVTPPPSKEDTATFETELRQMIISETNNFRKKNKVSLLSYEYTLEKNARAYSRTLLSGNFLSHTDTKGCDMSCRFKRDGFVAQAWGENLAVLKFSDMPSAREVATYFMREWEKSEGHRENLLSPKFTHQGIGVAISNKAIYVTVQFADPL